MARSTRSARRLTAARLARPGRLGPADRKTGVIDSIAESAAKLPVAAGDAAGVASTIRAVLEATGYRRRADRVPSWPPTFNDREVLAAWAWKKTSVYVGVFWARGVEADEVGVYSFGSAPGDRGTWYTAPPGDRVALHIAGLGEMLRGDGFGPAMNVARPGELVSDLLIMI